MLWLGYQVVSAAKAMPGVPALRPDRERQARAQYPSSHYRKKKGRACREPIR